HPYCRIARKKPGSARRRKVWGHALEKLIFTPHELFTLGAPERRAIYIGTLEAHIDELHEQLINRELFPVTREQLQVYTGLSSVTAKSMLSTLQHDAVRLRTEVLELQRAVSS
ncbi:hypothetical protein C8Q76DRAFT_630371, partial [Earliella scabrosa]